MAEQDEEKNLDLASQLVETYKKANVELMERVSIIKNSYSEAAKEHALIKQVQQETEKAINEGIYSFSGILNFQKGINIIKTNPIRSDAVRIGGTESFKTNLPTGKELPCATIMNNIISICFKGN